MAFIAGHYSGTYNSLPMSTTERGWTIHEDVNFQPVIADEAGDVPLDGIYLGTGVQVSGVFIEWDLLMSTDALFATYTENGTTFTPGYTLANVGGPMVNGFGTGAFTLSKPLVLTYAGANTAINPQVVTFPNAIVLGDRATLLGSRLRQVPLVFYAFPTRSTGTAYTYS